MTYKLENSLTKDKNFGRLLIWKNNAWYSICDDNVFNKDINVKFLRSF